MIKTQVLQAIIDHLERERDALFRAAQAAHQTATHEQSRAEDHHDTFGLEASYLAGAQQSRVAQLDRTVTYFRGLASRESGPMSTIIEGSLAVLESGGRQSRYFFAAQGGGITIEAGGQTIQVLTSQSPLGEALLGKEEGDEVEIEAKDQVREYRVVEVN
jgi:hypothetical protein